VHDRPDHAVTPVPHQPPPPSGGDRPEYYGDTVITGEVRNRVDRLWDLDGSRFSADQIHFVNLIVDELTANGIMEPVRLFEPPYTDHAPTGPDYFFPEPDIEVIVETLYEIRDRARPTGAA